MPGTTGKFRTSQATEGSSPHAEVAELVDALASGASDRKVVEVQVLFSAPAFEHLASINIYYFHLTK